MLLLGLGADVRGGSLVRGVEFVGHSRSFASQSFGLGVVTGLHRAPEVDLELDISATDDQESRLVLQAVGLLVQTQIRE